MDILKIFDVRDKFNEFVNIVAGFVGQQQWGAIFLVLLVTLIIERLALFIFKRILRLAQKTGTKLDDQVINKSLRPVGNFILLFGFFIIIQFFKLPKTPIDIKLALNTGTKIAVMLNTIWLFLRLTDVLGSYLITKVVRTNSKLDDQLIPIFQKTIKIFLYLIGCIFIIQSLGYSISGVVAGLGIGGIAVAMASKDALANLFGSMMIITDRPFRVGDWVKIGDDEGVVEQIGLRSTRVRTFAKTQITIPNAVIANSSINNFSRMPKRRVKMSVGVTYDTTADQMETLVKDIQELLKSHAEVDQDFMLVDFTDFGPSSLDILVYYFTKTVDWTRHLEVRQEINLAIMRKVEESDLSIAFPTRTVHIKSENDNITGKSL